MRNPKVGIAPREPIQIRPQQRSDSRTSSSVQQRDDSRMSSSVEDRPDVIMVNSENIEKMRKKLLKERRNQTLEAQGRQAEEDDSTFGIDLKFKED